MPRPLRHINNNQKYNNPVRASEEPRKQVEKKVTRVVSKSNFLRPLLWAGAAVATGTILYNTLAVNATDPQHTNETAADSILTTAGQMGYSALGLGLSLSWGVAKLTANMTGNMLMFSGTNMILGKAMRTSIKQLEKLNPNYENIEKNKEILTQAKKDLQKLNDYINYSLRAKTLSLAAIHKENDPEKIKIYSSILINENIKLLQTQNEYTSIIHALESQNKQMIEQGAFGEKLTFRNSIIPVAVKTEDNETPIIPSSQEVKKAN